LTGTCSMNMSGIPSVANFSSTLPSPTGQRLQYVAVGRGIQVSTTFYVFRQRRSWSCSNHIKRIIHVTPVLLPQPLQLSVPLLLCITPTALYKTTPT
jgi:hypothetical protein